ncbi:MAG: NUDIX domain-containing protein [Clostridia bacterium]|nr:NUDIX domain-containing protein [Clostridia bacterium]
MNELILLNEKNDPIGYADKIKVHKKGLKHKAFSVFFYDEETDEFLIQKRAKEKYHSGGLWSNTCCSHFYRDEEEMTSLQRCISDELGIEKAEGELLRIGSFSYCSDYGQFKENERDFVYLQFVTRNNVSICTFSLDEIQELRWVKSQDLRKQYELNPKHFTSWFQNVFQLVCAYLESRKINRQMKV